MQKNFEGAWNVKELQERFFRKQDEIDRDLEQMRKQKRLSKLGYGRIYDEQLGALQIYVRLSVTASLSGRDRLLSELREMRSDGPVRLEDVFDQARVILGFNNAIDQLISEFEDNRS